MRADDIEIPDPCALDLREHIAGASTEFHCERCDRSVHVLSHMSEDEAARVLARRRRDNLCVAFLRTPEGRVHFRGAGERLPGQVVPASRLAGPRMMLRASTLALAVAACSSDKPAEQFVAVGGAPPTRNESATAPEGTHAEADSHARLDEELVAYGGAPPAWDEHPIVAEVEPDPLPEVEPEPPFEGYLRVDFDKLVVAHAREPDRRALRRTKAGRGGLHAVEIEYYIDEHGQVVDAKHVRGNKELARVYAKAALGWQFDPYEYEGRATRVVTKQQIMIDLDRDEPLDGPA